MVSTPLDHIGFCIGQGCGCVMYIINVREGYKRAFADFNPGFLSVVNEHGMFVRYPVTIRPLGMVRGWAAVSDAAKAIGI